MSIAESEVSRWLAYVSDDSGRPEIYVQPFAPLAKAGSSGGSRMLVSQGGGLWPRWRAGGGELFFEGQDRKLMSVTVTRTTAFQAGIPRLLFRAPSSFMWDAAANGMRFLTAVPVDRDATQPFTVLLNWQAGLKK